MRKLLSYIVRPTIFLGLALLTFWVVRRSDAGEDARKFYARNDLINALRRSLDHLERRPSDHDASKTAALCLSRMDFAAAAEPYYRSAGGIERLDLEESHVRALALARANRSEEAVAAYRAILSRWPDNPTATQRLATIHLTMARYPDALALANRLTEMPGKAVVGYALAGSIAHQDDVPEDAAAAYEKVLALDPGLRELPFPAKLFWTEFISDLLASGRAGDAQKYLARIAGLDPADPTVLDMKAQVAFQEGDMKSAEENWALAKKGDPRLFRPWRGLGQIALGRGDVNGAIENLGEALKLVPDDSVALYQLSLAYRRAGRASDAERLRVRFEEIKRNERPSKRGMGAMPADSP